MKPQFFGHPEASLFGVHHTPHGAVSGPVRAAIICPPIGQEYIRTHWNLRLLAKQIARQGIHVLRFDYSGFGDSAGQVAQIDNLNIWRNDISTAIDHLKATTNAETVMLIGQRYGSLLAGEVALQRCDVNSLVLWDPVVDGGRYLEIPAETTPPDAGLLGLQNDNHQRPKLRRNLRVDVLTITLQPNGISIHKPNGCRATETNHPTPRYGRCQFFPRQ